MRLSEIDINQLLATKVHEFVRDADFSTLKDAIISTRPLPSVVAEVTAVLAEAYESDKNRVMSEALNGKMEQEDDATFSSRETELEAAYAALSKEYERLLSLAEKSQEVFQEVFIEQVYAHIETGGFKNLSAHEQTAIRLVLRSMSNYFLACWHERGARGELSRASDMLNSQQRELLQKETQVETLKESNPRFTNRNEALGTQIEQPRESAPSLAANRGKLSAIKGMLIFFGAVGLGAAVLALGIGLLVTTLTSLAFSLVPILIPAVFLAVTTGLFLAALVIHCIDKLNVMRAKKHYEASIADESVPINRQMQESSRIENDETPALRTAIAHTQLSIQGINARIALYEQTKEGCLNEARSITPDQALQSANNSFFSPVSPSADPKPPASCHDTGLNLSITVK
ncbi:hypothetical protein [Legionella sp. CNM-4043-24]|uniref:hypothetical protein n=1 Tax=Legionella sp. CNM-4043-24 TaxID=3421646 RepID=UPI00403AA870